LKTTEGATHYGAIKLASNICHPARRVARAAFIDIQIGQRDSAPLRSFARRIGPPPFARALSQAKQEKIMKKLQLAAIMVLCLSTQAFAQSAQWHRHHRRAHAPAPAADQFSAIMPSAPAPSGVTNNANDCAPDHPEAVWGAGGALLGYSCVTPNAN
jgi:hypothetical protein